MPHNILVVDDEPDLEILITQRFRQRIRGNELSFQFAGNGEEALAKLQSSANMDVVLTDINMPVMDGLTLLLRLREAHPLLRPVIVSAYGDMSNIRTALNRGAFDFVTKPIDFADLEITLDKAIGDSVLRKQAANDRDSLLVIHRELELARAIQESLVPCDFPADSRYQLHGSMTPATQVGGDFFDFFALDSRRLAFAIGDVAGKGFGAAMYMAVSRTVLRVAAGKGLAPHECMREVNRFLCSERRGTLVFLTCFYGILDLESGHLAYTRAGHNPPYRIHAGAVEPLDAAGGLPLGILEPADYETAELQLDPGDSVVLFTDGLSEAMNAQQEMFGEERLVTLLEQQPRDAAVADVVRDMAAAANAFADGAPASDDMTMMCIRYCGNN
jgi:phosphoserine phosphatase RsbU/P